MAGQRHREVDEKPSGARADEDRAEHDEKHDIGCRNQQRYAEDTDRLDELAIDEPVDRHRRAVEHADEPVGLQGLENEEPGDDDHRPADHAAGGLDHQTDQYPAINDVGRIGRAFAGLELLDIGEDIDLHREHHRDHCEIDAETEHALCISGFARLPDGFGQRRAEHRLDQESEQQHRAQMGRAEGQRFRRTEPGDEDMVHRERDSQRRGDKRKDRRQVKALCAQDFFEQRIFALFLVLESGGAVGHGAVRVRPPPRDTEGR